MDEDLERQIAGIASLSEPIRRSLYLLVARSSQPVGREQAATTLGVGRALAAFHLDKLAEHGLLDVEYRRLTGRTGPGAGRPAKLYRRSARQLDVSLPPREYDLAGELMARAIESAEATGRPVRQELEHAAFTHGCAIGDQIRLLAGRRPSKARVRRALSDVLTLHGFEPRSDDTELVLTNCPFHALARAHTELICTMNLHLVRGMRSRLSLSDEHLRPHLDPDPDRCCVVLAD